MATSASTGLGSPAAPPLAPPQLQPSPGFSILSPSTWSNFWSSAPAAQPSAAMEDALKATRQLTEALQEAANTMMTPVEGAPSGLADAAAAITDQMQNVQIGAGASAEGSLQSISRTSSFQMLSLDNLDEKLQEAQRVIKELSGQVLELNRELVELRSQAPAASATADPTQLSNEQYTSIIRRLNGQVQQKQLIIDQLQQRVVDVEQYRNAPQIVIQQVNNGGLGAKIDAYFQVFRVYLNEKSPLARAGIVSAITLATATVIYGVGKITLYATSLISEAIWGPPIDRNNPGPGRLAIPESDQTSVPVEDEVDEYGNPKIKYREALAEQYKKLQDQHPEAPVDEEGMIDLNYTDTTEAKTKAAQSEEAAEVSEKESTKDEL